MTIKKLSEDTIRKIAAGEVIERPASVIKELVENSIDAGADEIRVEIRQGGKASLSVSDNGKGISEEDFPLAFERHATSKIDEFEDLYRLHSLGFRGEALASIVAVGKVTARSKVEEAEQGLELHLENNQLLSSQPVVMTRGTTILVEDLFFNVPARQKFLKSDSTEGARISALMYSFAVGNPKISFRYIKDGRQVFYTNRRNTINENLLVLFGTSYYDALRSIEGKSEHFSVEGRIGDNTFYRGNRQMQFLFVNGRSVDDEGLRDAVEQVYRSIIPNGRFPAYQIFVETDPGSIEINIHPNKRRIEFHQGEELYQLIRQTIRDQLFRQVEIPHAVHEESSAKSTHVWDLSTEDSYQKLLENYRWAVEESPSGKKNTAPSHDPLVSDHPAMKDESAFEWEEIKEEGRSEEDRLGPVDREEEQSSASETEGTRDSEENLSFLSQETKRENGFPEPSRLTYIGCLFLTYLILEDRQIGKSYFMDQHAAHERINYERFMKQLNHHCIISQSLSPAVEVPLTEWENDRLERRETVLKDLGFDFSYLSPEILLLRQVPVLFQTDRPQQLFTDLLDENFTDLADADDLRNRIAMKACKASVKKGSRLSLPEVDRLLRDLAACQYPFTCPHGRPTMITLSETDLEKMFMRIK